MKCKKCLWQCPRFSPVLVPSGYSLSSGRDLKCPVCDTLYSSMSGEEFNKEEYERKQERLKATEDYNRGFGQATTSPKGWR